MVDMEKNNIIINKTNSKYKIAIFDMDGTILDTLTDIYNAINYALKFYNQPVRSYDEVRTFVGNGLRKLTERAVPTGSSEELIEKVCQELITYYGKHSTDNTAPYEGINKVIARLKERGIVTAVVSNKADFAVQKLAKGYFEGLFDYAIGEQTGFATKPAPDMVLEILNRAGISKEEAVYIGDSDVDLMTAKNSGMDCIAVTWGFRGLDFLIEHGAGIIANKPEDLLDLI